MADAHVVLVFQHTHQYQFLHTAILTLQYNNATANRSEIATRIIRAATELNMESVAVYAFEDRNNPHRWCADQSFLLPASGTPVGAYLNIENLIKIAKDNGVDAIHPGYGFLSESAEFAQACADAGITFVGPKVEHLEIFGDKTKARELAINAGVSVVPGTDGAVTDLKDAEDFVDKYGLPVMIKAAKGGGGKGMRVVRERKDLIPFFKAFFQQICHVQDLIAVVLCGPG